MFWSLAAPATVRQGETAGSFHLFIDDIPGTPPTVTATWALLPWNGDAPTMSYVAATVGTPVQHEDPRTGFDSYSVEVTMPKNLIPSDIPLGLYFLSLRFHNAVGPTVEFPLPKRAIAVTVEVEP